MLVRFLARLGAIAGLGLLTACGTLGTQLAKPRGADLLDGAAINAPSVIEGKFQLVDTSGRQLTEADFVGRARLVYFGYTSCPEICGLELDTITAAAQEVGLGTEELAMLFVTVDPARDTAERLRGFAGYFHPDLLALRGSELETAQAARSHGVFYRRNDDDMGDANYTMDHSTFIYLFDRDGRYVRAFPYMTAPEEIATELRRLVADRQLAQS